METLAAAAALSLFLTLTLTAAPLIDADTVDCSPILLKLADCLDYVSEGSTIDKPVASCCNGLKDVLKASPDCLCVGFRSSAQFGVKLNLSKAFGLPSACHLSPPPTDCALAPAPLVAPPTTAPGPGSPSTPAPEVNVRVPTPSSDSENVVVTPASTPEKSGSAAISFISLTAAAFGLLFASFVRM